VLDTVLIDILLDDDAVMVVRTRQLTTGEVVALCRDGFATLHVMDAGGSFLYELPRIDNDVIAFGNNEVEVVFYALEFI
jgi:hypothetical protein